MGFNAPPPRRQAFAPRLGPPWYVTLFSTIAIAAAAYVLAGFAYLLLEHISMMPHGPLWDVSFRGPFLFVMLTVVVLVMAVPYFNKEWDSGLRTFCLFATIFLIAFAVFRNAAATPFDPDNMLDFFVTKVFAPLHRLIGY